MSSYLKMKAIHAQQFELFKKCLGNNKNLYILKKQQAKEIQEAIDNDVDGTFTYEMFVVELLENGYEVTADWTDCLTALNLDYKKIRADEKMLNALEQASDFVLQNSLQTAYCCIY